MQPTLFDELKGGIPALVALIPAIAVIRFVCGRLGLRRLRLALSLLALAVSLGVFRRWAPTIALPFAPYLWVAMSFAGIYFVFKLAEVVLLDVLWRRGGRAQPPGIFRDVISTLFASVVLVILLQAGLNVHVATLVITSAALSIFLGLALQQSVSDIFAGVALVIERPFAPGDWVRIGDRVGRVEEISWRAVRIRLQRVDDYLIMPNSVIAKADIVNMSSPSPLHGDSVEVGVAYQHPPNHVRDVMVQTALEVPGVLARPAPVAEVLRFDDSAIAYRLTYWIEDLPRSLEIQSTVRGHLWYAFERAGLEIPFPIVRNYVRPLDEATAATDQVRQARAAELLGRVEFLTALKPEQVAVLAKTSALRLYPSGAMVFRKGEPGDSLFIVASGRVEILTEPPGGGLLRPIAFRDAGDSFGEISLLTGAPRQMHVRVTADAELLVLTRDVLRPILVGDPGVAERLSQTVSRHRAGDQEALERLAGAGAPRVAEAVQARTLLGSIRRAFGLGSEPW